MNFKRDVKNEMQRYDKKLFKKEKFSSLNIIILYLN